MTRKEGLTMVGATGVVGIVSGLIFGYPLWFLVLSTIGGMGYLSIMGDIWGIWD